MERFFRDLYDFSFHDFVFPRIIKVLFVIGLIVLGIFAIFAIISAFVNSIAMGLLTLVIIAPIAFVLYSILIRVYLEIVMVLFRINEGIQEQTRLLAARGPGGNGDLPESEGAAPELP